MENPNEKALKIIERQYASFIDLSDGWGFFRGLAEYTKAIQSITVCEPFIEALEKQREAAQKTYELMNTDAMRELTRSAERLTAIADAITKQYEPVFALAQEMTDKYQPIIDAVTDIRERMSGSIFSSNPVGGFEADLFDVAKQIRASGHADAIKEFENDERRVKNIYGNYTFSRTYEYLEEEKDRLERREQVETWGAWQHLPVVHRLVFEPEKMEAELRAETEEDRSLRWTFFNFMGVAGEMEKIRQGKVSDNDVVYFRVSDFRNYARRVHSHVTTELLLKNGEEERADAMRFDDGNRVLFFKGKSIAISKKEDSDAHKLMRTLFKNAQKTWANDEVLEDWGYRIDDNVPTHKVYQASRKINSIIAQDTTIKDFLVISTKTVAINEKWLGP